MAPNREVQATSQASSQVTLAFMALDGEIRYAADINEPGQDTSNPPNYYVEIRIELENELAGRTGLYTTGVRQLERGVTAALVVPRWISPHWLAGSGIRDANVCLHRPVLFVGRSAPWQLSVGDLVGDRRRLDQREGTIVVHDHRPRHNRELRRARASVEAHHEQLCSSVTHSPRTTFEELLGSKFATSRSAADERGLLMLSVAIVLTVAILTIIALHDHDRSGRPAAARFLHRKSDGALKERWPACRRWSPTYGQRAPAVMWCWTNFPAATSVE